MSASSLGSLLGWSPQTTGRMQALYVRAVSQELMVEEFKRLHSSPAADRSSDPWRACEPAVTMTAEDVVIHRSPPRPPLVTPGTPSSCSLLRTGVFTRYKKS